MRPDGGKEAPGALAWPAWGEEEAPACAIVPDGGMKASQGNRPPRAAFTHPAGMAMRRKRERPPGRPCPGGRSTAAGEKGKTHRTGRRAMVGGKTGGHGHAMQKNRAPPMAGRRPCAGGSQREKGLEPRSPPSFRHGGTRPVAFTHPTVCVPVVQPDLAGVIFVEPDHIPAGHQATGPAVDDQASDLTPGVTVKQGQCRVPGPQVQGRTGLVMRHKQPRGLTRLRPTPVRV